MKKQLFWLLVILTIFAGFLIRKDTASAKDMSGGIGRTDIASVTSGTVLDGWSFDNITVSGSAGSSPVLTAGSAKADSGAQTTGSGFTGFHASSATVWSTPVGNGSPH